MPGRGASYRQGRLRTVVLLATGLIASSQAVRAETLLPRCDKSVSAKDTEIGHQLYLAGKAAYDEGNYTKAVGYFTDAYTRDCTKPEVLLILSRADELNGDKRSAAQALRLFLERVPQHPDAELHRTRLGNLEKQASDKGRASEETPAPVPAPSPAAGKREEASEPAAVRSKEPSTSPSQDLGPRPLAPLFLAAGGAAVVLAGAVVHVVGGKKISDAEAVCPDPTPGRCPEAGRENPNIDYPRVLDVADDGRTLSGTVAPILYGVGGALLVGGLLWYFLAPRRPSGTPPQAYGMPTVGGHAVGWRITL